MRMLILAASLLVATPALAKEVHRLSWDVTLDGQKVGARTATVTIDDADGTPSRMIEAVTDISAKVGPIPLQWQQRLTILGAEDPAAFHAVINENGAPREVQGRWTGSGWVVTLADRQGSRTWDAAPHRIHLSTADLFDPGSTWRLAALDQAKILSAETGDIREGAVERLGSQVISVDGTPVQVQGWSWTSPEGRSEFWYDVNGWLVRYQMRVMGHQIAGTLVQPPPEGPDTFAVEPESGDVRVLDL